MPRPCRAAIVPRRGLASERRSLRNREFGSWKRLHSYVPSRSGLTFALDSGEVEGRLRLLPALHPPEASAVCLDVGEQGGRIDAEIARRVPPDLLRAPLQESHSADRVAVLRVMVRRADLDEALEE